MGRKDYWAVIEPKDIEDGNILSVLATLRELDRLEATGEQVFRCLALVFRGFDDTSEEVWEMPKVREWAHKLINRVPYLFYYLENDRYQTEQTMMLCINDFTSMFPGERKTPEEFLDEEGLGVEDLPQHKIKIHIHRKSYREMISELRKFAVKKHKKAAMETVIAEMNDRYGMEI